MNSPIIARRIGAHLFVSELEQLRQDIEAVREHLQQQILHMGTLLDRVDCLLGPRETGFERIASELTAVLQDQLVPPADNPAVGEGA